METHDLEIAAANNSSSNFARFTQAHHCKTNHREVPKFRNRLDASLKVLDIGDGEQRILHAHTGCALADIDKAVLVSVYQRAEENATHEAEDGGVGADAEGQGDDDS